MENKTNYAKRIQKGCSLSFKHQVVFEVEKKILMKYKSEPVKK